MTATLERTTKQIDLFEIVGNTNPRNPLSKDLQKMGYLAFEEGVIFEGSGDKKTKVTLPSLWKLGTSEDANENKKFVDLIRDNDPEILSLANRIARQGLLQPIEVREANGGLIVTFGARRTLAALYNYRTKQGEDKIEARIANISEADAMNRAASENIRLQPNPMEEARAMKMAMNAGSTYDDLAAEYGTHVNTIRNRINLLKLPDDLQEKVAKGTLKPIKALETAKKRKSGKADEDTAKPQMQPRKTLQELYDNSKDLTKDQRKFLAWVLCLAESY